MHKRLIPLILGLTCALTPPAAMAGVSGPYLAARQASFSGNFTEAARYYSEAIMHDPSRPELLERAALAHVSLGKMDRAVAYAEKLEEGGYRSQVAHMAILADLGQRDVYEELLARVTDARGAGPLADGLIRAWSLLGQGDMTAALVAFDDVAKERGLSGFATYHKALALASVGDYESADALFSSDGTGSLRATRRGVMAHAEILSQLGRNDDALALLEQSFGRQLDPGLTALRDALTAGTQVPFTHVRSARDGLAEVFYSLAGALSNEADEDFTLMYARVAEHLRPDHVDAILLVAELLRSLRQPELAVGEYSKVPSDHPAFHAAELGRADALLDSERTEAALEVLRALTRTHGTLPIVHATLGDTLRQQEQFAEAVTAYDRALELSEEDGSSLWFIHYARGISHERLGQWPQAEADFRKALEYNPNQPQVLNYLGYSLVEKQIKLDEALDMIERAVAAQPDSGYIVDSLGWVLYRLGRYEEAVAHMERATELMPIDPVVNDHLGDVYWAVGREMEARFQWSRALSFIDHGSSAEEVDPDRIRRKLEVGLDQVLAEEGAPPLKVARDDN